MSLKHDNEKAAEEFVESLPEVFRAHHPYKLALKLAFLAGCAHNESKFMPLILWAIEAREKYILPPISQELDDAINIVKLRIATAKEILEGGK